MDRANSKLPADSCVKGTTPVGALGRMSRREFARNAAIAAAASLSPSSLLSAEHIAAIDLWANQASGKGEFNLTPEQEQEVDSRLTDILRKYGDRFTDDQKKRLRRILTYNEKLLAPIRAFSLKNGDPPADVLRLFSDQKSISREARARNSPGSQRGAPNGEGGTS